MQIPKKWLYSGIRAFADDEGHVGKSSIILFSANPNLLNGIKQILDFLKIRNDKVKSRFSQKAKYSIMYHLEIKDLELYRKKVGFTHPKKKEKLYQYVKNKKTKRRKRLLKLKS